MTTPIPTLAPGEDAAPTRRGFRHVRVIAYLTTGGVADKSYSVSLMCRLNERGRIAADLSNQCYGCVHDQTADYPFLLNSDFFCYGYFAGNAREKTDILSKDIAKDSYFTVDVEDDTPRTEFRSYRISSVVDLSN